MKGLLCLRPGSLWSLWGFFNLAYFSQQDASQKSCWSRRVDNVISNLTERKRGPWGNAHYVFFLFFFKFKLQSSQCIDYKLLHFLWKLQRHQVYSCVEMHKFEFPWFFHVSWQELTGNTCPPPQTAQTSYIVSSFFTQLSKQSALLLERSTNK